MYKSPIDLIVGQMNLQLEGEVCKAVQNYGVDVDKDELLKALQYDRGQYEKGYKDRDTEIVRCQDCEHSSMDSASYPHYWCSAHAEEHEANWFCADGELRS